MAIVERQSRPTEIPETVSDLLRGFAVLATVQGRSMEAEDAFSLLEVVQSLLARAKRCEWEESVDLLEAADTVLNRRIAPRR